MSIDSLLFLYGRFFRDKIANFWGIGRRQVASQSVRPDPVQQTIFGVRTVFSYFLMKTLAASGGIKKDSKSVQMFRSYINGVFSFVRST